MTSGQLNFDGRVAIVTGAASGLGRAYARFFAAHGAAVVVNDLRAPDETLAEIAEASGRAVGHQGDVSSESDVQAMVDLAIERYGRVDIVVNNAGIDSYVPFFQLTPDDFDLQYRVHLRGSFLLIRAAWPHMVRQNYGRLVSTSSSAMLGSDPGAAYGAAKGGVLGLMKCLAVEGRSHNIHANVVMPYAATPMNADLEADAAAVKDVGETAGTLDVFARLFTQMPSSPDLVAPAVGWLCHEDCEVSGEIVHAGFGAIGRVFMAQGPVWTGQEVTIESVRDTWAHIAQESPARRLEDCPSAGLAMEDAILSQQGATPAGR